VTQKGAKEGTFAARSLKTRTTLRGCRFFRVLILVVGFVVACNQLANAQRYFDDSGDSTLLRGLTYVAPPNNNFVNSILLSNFLAFGFASTSGATAEPGEPPHDGHPATHSIWWRWIAPDSGLVKLSTLKEYGYPTWDPYHEAPGIPLYIGIYTGSSLTNLAPVSLLPGSSANVGTDSGEPRTYVFNAISGETYNIAGDNLYDCRFFLSLANISLSQPTVLTNLPGDQPVTLEYSALDTNATIVWLEVFAGTNSLGIATNTPFQFQYMPAGSGSVAIWAVGTNSLSNTLASFTNTLTFSPLNDDFAKATLVTNTGESGSYFADSQFATAEPGEPDIIPGTSSTHTVWWKWNPLYNVATRITLFSSSSALSIFKGTNLDSLEFVGMVQNPNLYPPWGGLTYPNYATLSFTPEPGATYYVAGEGSPEVSWAFFQQTFEILPAGSVRGFDGDSFDLEAIWHEPIGPGPVDFVIGEEELPILIVIPPNPTVIGRLGPIFSPPYRVTWTPTNCGTYFLWATFTNGAVTNIDFGVTNIIPATRDTDKTVFQILPRNDFFSNATVIAPDTRSTNFFFNMAGASVEAAEPRHRDGPAVGTRWWAWTPSYSGTVRLKAIREMQPVPLEVFTGSAISKLSRIADNLAKTYRPGVSGALMVPVKAGKKYIIRVDDTCPYLHHPTAGLTNITLTLEPGTNRPHAEIYFSLFKSSKPGRDPVPAARVFMPDGQTPVYSADFRAQLYVGNSATNLAAVGPAQPFYASPWGFPYYKSGVPWPVPIVLSDTKTFTRVFAQVRVWDSTAGATYEAAQAAGGLIGESKVLRVITGSEDAGPGPLTGISSFTLHGAN
jgi:hypothetical protein